MKSNLFSKVIKIDALLFDVDGVMTDGKIYSSDNGECFKAFNASDGLGIKLLNEYNIITGVISGRDSEDLAHSTVSVRQKSWLKNRRIDHRELDEDPSEMKDCRSTVALTTFNGGEPACEYL